MHAVLLLVIVSLTCHTDQVASLATTQEYCNDIIHVQRDGKCMSVCDDSSCDNSESCKCFQHLKFDCSEYSNFGIVSSVLGYWYDNNVSYYAPNCPGEYCGNYFPLWSNYSSPDRNEQCSSGWEGTVCGECKGYNSIIFDTMKCVSHDECKKYGDLWNGWPWLLVFLTTLLYWCVFILLAVIILKFKFDASVGYAYGLLFYYSVLENFVRQKVSNAFFYDDSECQLSDNKFYISTFEATILSSLASIGNLKPPYLQFMKLCLNTQVIDHVVFVYTHPVIVVSLLAIIAIAARKSSKLTQFIQRHSNFMICLILLLSYSSVSYTSVQLLKPLIVYDRITGERKWHFYWSPSIPFADGWRLLYVIVAVLCIVIISIGLPLLLLFHQVFASKLKVNLTRIKPILDQLQGCYKDEYRWFAAYYLICRQVIYIFDLVYDFLSSSVIFSNTQKHTTVLIIIIFIMMIHVWFQPYKKRSLNAFDSVILMIIVFAIFASNSYSIILRITLWFLPLAICLCYMTSSTKLKHIMIPIFCLGTIASCVVTFILFEFDMLIIVLIIMLISLYYLIKWMKEIYKSCQQRPRAGYLQLNRDDDHNEELYKRYKHVAAQKLGISTRAGTISRLSWSCAKKKITVKQLKLLHPYTACIPYSGKVWRE